VTASTKLSRNIRVDNLNRSGYHPQNAKEIFVFQTVCGTLECETQDT